MDLEDEIQEKLTNNTVFTAEGEKSFFQDLLIRFGSLFVIFKQGYLYIYINSHWMHRLAMRRRPLVDTHAF